MPAAEAAQDEDRRAARYHFHLTGDGETGDLSPLWPAVLAASSDPRQAWSRYPVAMLAGTEEGESSAVPLATLIERALASCRDAGHESQILDEHRVRLVAVAARIVDGRGGMAPMGEVLDLACASFVDEFDMSTAGTATLLGEIEQLKPRLPRSGHLVTLGSSTLLRLYGQALLCERETRRRAFSESVEPLIGRLSDLLRVDADHDPEGLDPAGLSSTFGEASADLVDPAALSAHLRSTILRGSKRLDPARKARIETARETLKSYLDRAEATPACVLVHSGSPPEGAGDAAVELVCRADGMGAAIEQFDEHVEGIVDVLRAVRVARLELESAYDPRIHDAMLEHFGWESFDAEELLLVPPVVVWESGDGPHGRLTASFSELLLSGRPIHVIVSEKATRPQGGGGALTGYLPGLGYVAVAHREAFVLQSTLARPIHVLDGLRRLASAVRPAAALVSIPSGIETVPPWVELEAAHDARANPCFRYDPDAGESWAERFDLSENLQPERRWPVVEIPCVDHAGAESSREEAFTFAHALALDPLYRSHFRILEPEDWSEEQWEIADYLAAGESERRGRIPFIWVVEEGDNLARAVMTREIAFACRDRMRAWRILQELAGTDNEYARRAAAGARRFAEQEAASEREKLDAAHAEELERVRQDAAREAIDRLVAVLMEFEPATAAAAAFPAPAANVEVAPAPPTEEKVEEARPEPEQDEDEDDDVSFNEPFIDSPLCTTCNECTNLNSNMFGYNGDKQAYLVDASAGNFEQLVKAAEKCPAHCIHPGTPRAGDETATEELVARAARFN
jgi:hypothetical protein